MSEWNPDDVVLTVWGAVEIEAGKSETAVLDALERDTRRTRNALKAAVRAVTTPEMQADVLRLLLQPLNGISLFNNRRLLNQLVRAIRARRAAEK